MKHGCVHAGVCTALEHVIRICGSNMGLTDKDKLAAAVQLGFYGYCGFADQRRLQACMASCSVLLSSCLPRNLDSNDNYLLLDPAACGHIRDTLSAAAADMVLEFGCCARGAELQPN